MNEMKDDDDKRHGLLNDLDRVSKSLLLDGKPWMSAAVVDAAKTIREMTGDEMIEKVARAMCAANGTIWGGPRGDDDPDFLLTKIYHMNMARAAIEEMRGS